MGSESNMASERFLSLAASTTTRCRHFENPWTQCLSNVVPRLLSLSRESEVAWVRRVGLPTNPLDQNMVGLGFSVSDFQVSDFSFSDFCYSRVIVFRITLYEMYQTSPKCARNFLISTRHQGKNKNLHRIKCMWSGGFIDANAVFSMSNNSTRSVSNTTKLHMQVAKHLHISGQK